jgi:hypothetical protein
LCFPGFENHSLHKTDLSVDHFLLPIELLLRLPAAEDFSTPSQNRKFVLH